MSHALHPFPGQLCRLLIRGPNRQVANQVDAYLARHSKYKNIGEWLDAEGDVKERRRLGERLVEILTDRSHTLLDE